MNRPAKAKAAQRYATSSTPSKSALRNASAPPLASQASSPSFLLLPTDSLKLIIVCVPPWQCLRVVSRVCKSWRSIALASITDLPGRTFTAPSESWARVISVLPSLTRVTIHKDITAAMIPRNLRHIDLQSWSERPLPPVSTLTSLEVTSTASVSDDFVASIRPSLVELSYHSGDIDKLMGHFSRLTHLHIAATDAQVSPDTLSRLLFVHANTLESFSGYTNMARYPVNLEDFSLPRLKRLTVSSNWTPIDPSPVLLRHPNIQLDVCLPLDFFHLLPADALSTTLTSLKLIRQDAEIDAVLPHLSALTMLSLETRYYTSLQHLLPSLRELYIRTYEPNPQPYSWLSCATRLNLLMFEKLTEHSLREFPLIFASSPLHSLAELEVRSLPLATMPAPRAVEIMLQCFPRLRKLSIHFHGNAITHKDWTKPLRMAASFGVLEVLSIRLPKGNHTLAHLRLWLQEHPWIGFILACDE